jgi:hypothetical protein
MVGIISKKEYTGLLFGEGGKDKNFLIKLVDLDKFKKFYAKRWEFNISNGSGGSPEDVLMKCKNEILGKSYDLVICFIDLDVLKHDFPKIWKKEKNKLEEKYSDVKIIWHIDKLEDEMIKVLGEDKRRGKARLNNEAKKNIKKFINSGIWKKILKVIKDCEKYLDGKNK